MGMFDSVMLDVKCPYCGETSEREAQTKGLDCIFTTWRVGDHVSSKLKYLDCITSCHSDKCSKKPTANPWRNEGKHFYINVFLDDKGNVTGKYTIQKTV